MPAGKVKSSPTQHKSERLRTVTHALSRKRREKAPNVRVSIDANTGVDGVGRGPRCPDHKRNSKRDS